MKVWMDGCMDGCTVCRDRMMDGWCGCWMVVLYAGIDGWMVRMLDGCTVCRDRWMDGADAGWLYCMQGWMDGWMDG